MPYKPTAIIWFRRWGDLIRSEFTLPGAILIGDDLNANLNFLDRPAVHHPYDAAARLTFCVLYADYVADFQLIFEPGKKRTRDADIARPNMLRKRLAVGSHAPDSYREIGGRPRIWPVFAHRRRMKLLPLIIAFLHDPGDYRSYRPGTHQPSPVETIFQS